MQVFYNSLPKNMGGSLYTYLHQPWGADEVIG
jgi:hypothetical protein